MFVRLKSNEEHTGVVLDTIREMNLLQDLEISQRKLNVCQPSYFPDSEIGGLQYRPRNHSGVL